MVKTDNRVENLEIMTIGEHRSLHNKLKPLKHGSDGRFLKIGVSKSGNIGESCDANPEIALELRIGPVPLYSVADE